MYTCAKNNVFIYLKYFKSNNFVFHRVNWQNIFWLLLQAFLEMADENAAATMVTYYASGVAQLRGRAVYVQFSNHRELKTDQTHSNNAVSSPTNDVANTSEVCVILLASLLSRFTKPRNGCMNAILAELTLFRSPSNTRSLFPLLLPIT